MRAFLVWTMAACAVLHAGAARAQSDLRPIEVGVQVTSAWSGQFDAADTGVGGRVSWRPSPVLGLEGELNVFPRDFPDRPPFSRRRLEGLFGATAGPTFGRVRP
ncbi:MAG: hypothetical protein ACRD3C_00785, partial [Vicinamibacterales bacterium]